MNNEHEIEMMSPLTVGDKITDFAFNFYQDGKFQEGKMSNYEGK